MSRHAVVILFLYTEWELGALSYKEGQTNLYSAGVFTKYHARYEPVSFISIA